MPEYNTALARRLTNIYLPALTVAIPGAAYLASLPKTLYWGDGIELAGAGRVLGIAHPTGYPLYTLMLHVAECLPLGTVSFRANLLSAALGVLAALIWYFLALKILRRLPSRLFRNEMQQGVIAAAVAIGMALSRTYWFHAVNAQTCALHMLFMAAGGWVCFAMAERFSFRLWAVAWLTFGLALAHHRLSLELGPLILIGAWCGHFRRRPNVDRPANSASRTRSALSSLAPRLTAGWALKALAVAGLALMLGLSPYIYMPIRAAKNPPQNWGNPTNLERFLWSARGGQFVDFMLLHYDPARPFTMRTYTPWAIQRTKHLASWALAQTGWAETRAPRVRVSALIALWILIGAGVWIWAREDRWAAAMAAAFCAVNLSVVFAYNIPDIHDYFEPMFPWGVLAAMLGWARVSQRIEQRYFGGSARKSVFGPFCLCMFVPLVMLLINRADFAYLKSPAPQEYGRRLLAGAEPHALVLTEGDSAIYSPWYQQNVEHFRTDVTVFGANFIAGSTWYREYFRDRHPFAMEFPFADSVLPSEQAYNDLWANRIIAPQLKTGRAIYTTFNRPFLRAFDVQPAMTLLEKDDYNCPEGMPQSALLGEDEYMQQIYYTEIAEGGIIPRPPQALRIKLKN
ncbi:MAG: DUF2723 domain-containing protein [Candidatus Sumerlaeota bacterium]|nr:DUF2723 domain-containing protein [Candidatus Sumerlaeota bacterium]